MTSSSNEKFLSIRLDDAFVGRLGRLAKKGGLSRHQFMKNLLLVGAVELELFKAIGLFQASILLRNLQTQTVSKKDIADKVYPIKLDLADLIRIDILADKADVSRNHLAKNILQIGLEETEAEEKLGLVDAAIWVLNLHDKFKEIAKRGERALDAFSNDLNGTT